MIEKKPVDAMGYTHGNYTHMLVRDGKVIGMVTKEYADELVPDTDRPEAEPATSQQGVGVAPQPDLSPRGAVEASRMSATESAALGDKTERQGAVEGQDQTSGEPTREQRLESLRATERNEARAAEGKREEDDAHRT